MHPLINEGNTLVAQICHIEAAEPGGPRYNERQTDEERRAYENLVAFCYRHHVETDDESKYSAATLKTIKADHERQFGEKTFNVDELLVAQLASDMEKYWHIAAMKNFAHLSRFELAIEIDTKLTFLKTVDLIQGEIDWLERYVETMRRSDDGLNDEIISTLTKLHIDTKPFESVPYYQNPFINRNWELHNLGGHNVFVKLRALLTQGQILYLQEHLRLFPQDTVASQRLVAVKKAFEEMAANASYVD